MIKRPGAGQPARPRLARPASSTGLANPRPRTGRPGAGLLGVGPDQLVMIREAGGITVGAYVNRNDRRRVPAPHQVPL